MVRLRVSAKARRDLEIIAETGVREHGPMASAAHIEGFRRMFRLLEDQPFAGRERLELGTDVRSLSHRPHSVFYHVEGGAVVIDRVIHQARDVRRFLRNDQ